MNKKNKVMRTTAKLVCALMLAGAVTTVSPRAEAKCANMLTQGVGAIIGFFAQGYELIDRINNNKAGQTAQAIAVGQSLVWAWWTMSTWWCNCPNEKANPYCAAIRGLPRPKKPAGNNGPPPVGPAIP